MPVIEPPNDDYKPEIDRLYIEGDILNTPEVFKQIQEFLNVKPWICSNCGATNHGRSKKCYCKTRRPDNFVLEAK